MPVNGDTTVHRGERPIIGILAQGIKDSRVLKYFSEARGRSYIAASYVKFVESGGARVIPISDQTTENELDQIFDSLNGVLLPGGGANILNSPFSATGKLIFEKAKQANAKGIHFPVFSICLGFELMVNLASDQDARSKNDCHGSRKISWREESKISKLFKTCNSNLMDLMSTRGLAFYNQKYGFHPKIFTETKSLQDFFHVLATSVNDNGEEFVAAAEAKEFPFFGLQWHPEKCQFEWNQDLDINHSPEAVTIGQQLANFFVNQARMNSNSFKCTRKENESLIWNYQPLYTGDISEYEQIYIL